MRPNYSKNSPGMWILFIVTLVITVGVTIFAINTFLFRASGETLPTKVFTLDKDVVSLRLPEDWTMVSSTTKKVITWQSKDGYESLSVSPTEEDDLKEASIMYMLELANMFPGVDASSLEYNENTINGKKAFAMNITYQSKYYICGVMESGNTIIKFVYSASMMTGEISDIDVIIGSINYRKGGITRE